MQLRAPAKINLSFRILGQRADGFHEIETLMAPVSLYDELTISRSSSSGIEFACDDPALPAGADNLAVRAARLFLERTGIEAGVRIELRKHIPHGAGLGGGSSDAAGILRGLNELFETAVPDQELSELAAEIGSDVPFFIYHAAAFCRGRGELVERTVLPSSVPLLLLKPSFGVPTPWAYSRWKDSRELPGCLYAPQQFGDLTFFNDLERPVFEKHVFLARMKMWLLAQAEVGAALLSGSGSTLLAVLTDGGAAEQLASRAKMELDQELWTHACETIYRRAVAVVPSEVDGLF